MLSPSLSICCEEGLDEMMDSWGIHGCWIRLIWILGNQGCSALMLWLDYAFHQMHQEHWLNLSLSLWHLLFAWTLPSDTNVVYLKRCCAHNPKHSYGMHHFFFLSQLGFCIRRAMPVLWAAFLEIYISFKEYLLHNRIISLHEILLSLHSSIPDDAGKWVPCYHTITESQSEGTRDHSAIPIS